MQPNNDFFKERGENKKNVYVSGKSPVLKINTPSKSKPAATPKISEEEKNRFPEYYALNEYSRKCLASTNYWRVMNGQKEIPVPESDLVYHKYFDKRCYKLKDAYQKKQELNKLELSSRKLEIKPEEEIHVTEPELTKKEEIVENVIIEEKPILEETVFTSFEPEPEIVKTEPEPKIENKLYVPEVKKTPPKKAQPKKSDDSQISIF